MKLKCETKVDMCARMQVLFNEYLNGQPVCHKCGSKHAPLQSNGWRQSMHPVLDRDSQFYVISFGLICPGCPAHEYKSEHQLRSHSAAVGPASPGPTCSLDTATCIGGLLTVGRCFACRDSCLYWLLCWFQCSCQRCTM